MDKSINILHITDLHMSDVVLSSFENMIRIPLKNDIQKTATGNIDLVFVTGDLVDKGGVGFSNLVEKTTYAALKEVELKVFNTLESDLGLEPESIFIVAGNHDINRSKDKERDEVGLLGTLTDSLSVSNYIKEVLSGENSGVKRLEEYRKFEEEFYGLYDSRKEDTFFTSSFIKKVKGIEIGISCINSSWRCYSDKDKGNLFVGDEEINKSKEIIADCNVKIALIHHHIDYLHESEKQLIENILLRDYDLVFFGHSHEFNNYSKEKGANKSIWIGSASGFYNSREDTDKYASGYSLCTLHSDKTLIQYRKYSYETNDYRIHSTIGDDGQDEFPTVIPESKEIIDTPISESIEELPEPIIVEDIPLVFENKLNRIKKPTTLYTGRTDKLDDLDKAYQKNDVLSVTGIGGIGKTELVLKYLATYHTDLKERITWHDFTGSSHFDNFIIAAGFGIIIQNNNSDAEKFSAFIDKLNEHQRIVIWDNLHDNEEDSFLHFLKFADGKLDRSKIIIISRTNENVDNYPNINLIDFKESEEYAKVLLNNRYPDSKLTDLEISEICTYVKGHPLALELALKLCGSVPSDKVIGKLSKHRKGIDELSQRLFEDILNQESTSEEERQFLLDFSVFKGEVSIDALQNILGDDCFYEVVPILRDKHLLGFKDGYYDTHPLIREFCYSKLTDKIELHAKTANYLIEQRKEGLDTILEDRIFHHLKGAEDYERIEETVEKYGRKFITQAVYKPLELMIIFLKSHRVIKPLFNLFLGSINELNGSLNLAQNYYQKTIQNTKEDEELHVEALLEYGGVFSEKGLNDEAMVYYLRAKTISERNNFLKFIAWVYNNISVIESRKGSIKKSYELRTKALRISEELGIVKDIATIHYNLAMLLKEEVYSFFDIKKAYKYSLSSLKKRELINDKYGIISNYRLLSSIYNNDKFQNKDDIKGEFYLERALRISKDIGSKFNMAICYNRLGDLYRKNDKVYYDLDKSHDFYEKALAVILDTDYLPIYYHVYFSFGLLYSNKDFSSFDLEKSLEYYEKSLGFSKKVYNLFDMITVYNNIGGVLYHLKDYSKAINYYINAYFLAKKVNYQGAKNNALSALLKFIKPNVNLKEYKRAILEAYNDLEPELQKYVEISDLLGEPRRSKKTYNRNDKLTVRYKDGRVMTGKYKKLEDDIDARKCEIIED